MGVEIRFSHPSKPAKGGAPTFGEGLKGVPPADGCRQTGANRRSRCRMRASMIPKR